MDIVYFDIHMCGVIYGVTPNQRFQCGVNILLIPKK